MCRRMQSALSWCTLLLIMFAAAPAANLHAQSLLIRNFRSGSRTGLGYTGAFPEAVLGAGAFRLFGTSGAGVFVDWKMTLERLKSDDDYCPPAIQVCEVAWVEAERNDQFVREEDDWLVFNLGGMYAITRELALMLGGGIAHKDRIVEFFHNEEDENKRITPGGGYFVDNPPASGWAGQLVVGALLRAGGNLAFRFGYETAPGGMSVGAYMIIP